MMKINLHNAARFRADSPFLDALTIAVSLLGFAAAAAYFVLIFLFV